MFLAAVRLLFSSTRKRLSRRQCGQKCEPLDMRLPQRGQWMPLSEKR
jgi:hypothetical protein